MASFKYENAGSTSAIMDGRMAFAEPGIQTNYAPDRTVKIAHYKLALALFPEEKRAEGSATIQFTRLLSHVGVWMLDCDEVQIKEVRWQDGGAISWELANGKLTLSDIDRDGAVCIRWTVTDPQRGLYFTGPTLNSPKRQHMAWTQCQDEDAHFFFPCHDHPGVRHSWSITLEGPVGYTLLSNGTEGDSTVIEDRVNTTFEQVLPMPAYLFTAVCAKLERVDSTWRDRPVRYFAPEGEALNLTRSMGKTPQMIELFSQTTGFDYAWPRYDQVVVHDFVFGGMENTACTTMTDVLLVDEKATIEWNPDGLVSHELAHQWFGNLVTCRDWSQGWLNESWATFMETVWWTHEYGEAETTWYRYGQAKSYFGEESSRYRRPLVSATFREPIDVFDRHLYEKGACVMSTLRFELGEDVFWKATKHYLEQNAHQPVYTRDFQKSFEEVTGRNLDRFFEHWVHGAGHPILDVTLGQEDGLVTVAVAQKQSGDDVAECFHFQLQIDLVSESGTRQVTLPVKERERTWAIPVSEKALEVRVDHGFRVLSKMTLSGPKAWLVAAALGDCPVLASRALHGLAKEGSVLAVDAIIRVGQEHPQWCVRAEAAGILAKKGGERAQSFLIERLKDESHPKTRREVATALGECRSEQTTKALLDALKSELPTWHLEGALLKSLGKMRDPRGFDVLVSALERPSWANWVAQSALDGLAKTEDERALPVILRLSGVEYDQRLRSGAARALAQFAVTQSAEVRAKAAERLVDMTREPGFRSVLGALGALATLREPSTLGALRQVHQSAPDGRTKRMAYEASVRVQQGRSQGEPWEPMRARLDALDNENTRLRERLEKLERKSID